MTLTLWSDWPDRDKGLALGFFGTIAAEVGNINGLYMTRSGGRRKNGRNTRYFVTKDGCTVANFTATSDREAVEKANAKLAKL